MARHSSIASHIAHLLDTTVVATNTVAGGHICVATRARLADGRSVFVKARPGAPDGFFAAEARALTWLSEAGPHTTPVPAVLGYSAEVLVLEWLEGGRPSTDAAELLGRRLAATHRAGADRFGQATDGFVGVLPLPNTPSDDWTDFFVTHRVEPYLRAAFNRGNLEADDANSVVTVMARIDEFAGPPEPPARVHGDLWSGNIIWSVENGPHVVDPAAYGGHREVDLAMLSLFGAPYLDRLLAAYDEVFALSEGWRDRMALYQLHPLLVHAAHFGGSYGARAGRTARELLAAAANVA